LGFGRGKMINKFVAAALLSFGVVTMVSSTEAAQLISSYTDVEKCPIPFERDDEFIFECTGPGGVKAVLYYVEGKVEIYYDEGGRTIGTHAGIIELSTRAPRAFGQKHEWRMKKEVANPAPPSSGSMRRRASAWWLPIFPAQADALGWSRPTIRPARWRTRPAGNRRISRYVRKAAETCGLAHKRKVDGSCSLS